MNIIKRMGFVIFFILWFPIIGISAYISAIIVLPIELIKWIIDGTSSDELYSFDLFCFVFEIPWKLFKV